MGFLQGRGFAGVLRQGASAARAATAGWAIDMLLLAWCYPIGPVWPPGLCAASAGAGAIERNRRWIHLLTSSCSSAHRTGTRPQQSRLGGAFAPPAQAVCSAMGGERGWEPAAKSAKQSAAWPRLCAGSCTLQLKPVPGVAARAEEALSADSGRSAPQRALAVSAP